MHILFCAINFRRHLVDKRTQFNVFLVRIGDSFHFKVFRMMKESMLICFGLVVSVSADILCGDRVCYSWECCVTYPQKHCREFSREYDLCNMPREDAKSYAYFCPCDIGMVCSPDELYCVKNVTVNTGVAVTAEAGASLAFTAQAGAAAAVSSEAGAAAAVSSEAGTAAAVTAEAGAAAAVSSEAGTALAVGPAGFQRCGDSFCPPWECCVNSGKKHCTSLRGLHDLCSPPSVFRGNYPFMCPCQSGLLCNPDTWFCERTQFLIDIITAQRNQAQRPANYIQEQVKAVSITSEKLCGDRICNPWECCATVPERRCRPLEREYDACTIPNEDIPDYGIYCPCEFGLVCDRKTRLCTKNITGSTEATATGQSGTPLGGTVSTGGLQICGDSICSPFECCISLGKKHCSPLTKMHNICGAYDDLEGSYPYFCPCEPGLKCNSVTWSCEVSETFTNITYISVTETETSECSTGTEVQ